MVWVKMTYFHHFFRTIPGVLDGVLVKFGLNEGHNADYCLGFGKLFNVLQSPIGRVASRPMRNIETFPSKQMYLYLSLVERKVAEFYHNMDRRHYLVWLN